MLAEVPLVDVGDSRLDVEVDPRDRRRAVDVSQVHAGGRAHRLGRVAVLVEDVAKGHRKARRVSGGDELLRIGPVALLKARAERVAALEYPVATSMMRWASADASAPDTTEIGDRHSTTFSKLAKSGEVTKAERGYR